MSKEQTTHQTDGNEQPSNARALPAAWEQNLALIQRIRDEFTNPSVKQIAMLMREIKA